MDTARAEQPGARGPQAATPTPSRRRGHAQLPALWLAVSLSTGLLQSAQAQFKSVPTPLHPSTVRPSEAETDLEYRIDAARRIYESFPMHIFRGQLPPLMHAIAITETDVDADGRVLAVRLVREPAAAKEVGPWVTSLIRKVGTFPALARMRRATYTDIWLVDKSGRFQLDTLTEGQRGEEVPASPVKVLTPRS